MLKSLRTAAVILLFLQFFALLGCSKQEPEPHNRKFIAMNTYITCLVVDVDEALATQALDKVEDVYLEIQQLTDRFDKSTEVSAVNAQAGIKPVVVSPEVFSVVETALKWAEKTDGSFNILLGSVMDLWDFGSAQPSVPAAEVVEEALTKTDWTQVILNKEQSSIYLPVKGMVMDLGGIAKGYATDKAVEALKEMGIKHGIINAGGNVYVLGSKQDGSPWVIGVQDPRDPQGFAAVLAASDSALVTSGDYERFFEVDGIRYHHIINPLTGYPAQISAGTTVIMKSATLADVLSTSLFVLGPEKGISLAESLAEVEAAMIITKEGQVYKTDHFDDYLAEQ